MRKFYMLLTAVLMSCGVWAQQNVVNNLSVKSVAADDEIVLSWLPEQELDTVVLSAGSPTTMTSFIEFDRTDILFNEQTKRKLSAIKDIQFFIGKNYLSTITEFRIILRQGDELAKSTVVLTQSVPVGGLTSEWNTVALETPYTIDPTKRIFIGCQVKFTSVYYPISFVRTKEAYPKQAWYLLGSSYSNISPSLLAVLMKTTVILEDPVENEISLLSIDIPHGSTVQEVPAKGMIRNLGKNSLTSFKAVFQIKGEDPVEESYTGLNILSGETYSFTHPGKFTPEGTDTYAYELTVSEPNGQEDYDYNNNMSGNIYFVSSLVQRCVLNEGFSSSYCGPCYNGNIVVNNVLSEVDENKHVSIKYQMNFPTSSTGNYDPYYTTECGTRSSFYSISSVPTLVADGPSGYKDLSSKYTTEILTDLAEIPAFANINAVATMQDRTVNLKVDFEFLRAHSGSSPDIRFFAAIVEKRTVKNTGSNGEKEFFHVMKKFLTPATGEKISSPQMGETYEQEFEFTFKGDYRLPSRTKPINHNIEHSVEDFDNLEVVYWIQDYRSQDVWQAGKKELHRNVGVENENIEKVKARIYPNPVKDILIIESDVVLNKIILINTVGQPVREGNVNSNEYRVKVSDLPSGIYILRMETAEGIFTQKIRVQ